MIRGLQPRSRRARRGTPRPGQAARASARAGPQVGHQVDPAAAPGDDARRQGRRAARQAGREACHRCREAAQAGSASRQAGRAGAGLHQVQRHLEGRPSRHRGAEQAEEPGQVAPPTSCSPPAPTSSTENPVTRRSTLRWSNVASRRAGRGGTTRPSTGRRPDWSRCARPGTTRPGCPSSCVGSTASADLCSTARSRSAGTPTSATCSIWRRTFPPCRRSWPRRPSDVRGALSGATRVGREADRGCRRPRVERRRSGWRVEGR